MQRTIRTVFKSGAFVVALAAVAGCVTRIGDFTMLSTKNMDMSRMDEYERTSTRVEGSHASHIIVVVPVGQPNIEEAVDEAVENVPGGVALVDAVVSLSNFYIPYIYGQTAYWVEGTVLVDPELR